MKNLIITTLFSAITLGAAAQNIGINNAAPNASAVLDVTSANKGLLIPRVALTASNVAAPVASPATSLLVYNTATAGAVPNNVTPGYYSWNGIFWDRLLTDRNESWETKGNTGTVAGTNFIGNTDSVDFITKTKNLERMRVKGNGRVSIGGITSPVAQLDVLTNTTSDTIVFRARNSSAAGTICQIGSIERFVDFSNTIDLNNGANSVGISINLNTAAAHDLQLAFDDAAKPGTNTWTIASDGRLKDDVNSFKDGLETIKQINPVYYRYNGKGGTPAGEYYVGVIAQELQKATPYMVGSYEYASNGRDVSNRETYLDVNNGALTYVLVNSVKELDEKTEKLSNALKTVTDFGVAEIISGNTVTVAFSEDFASSIQGGKLPVVTVTPVNSNLQVSVQSVTATGFTITTSGNAQNLLVNWIAAGKMAAEQLRTAKTYTAQEREKLLNKVTMKKSTIRTAEENAEAQRRKLENN
jgi:Chaperone of endosialidase